MAEEKKLWAERRQARGAARRAARANETPAERTERRCVDGARSAAAAAGEWGLMRSRVQRPTRGPD